MSKLCKPTSQAGFTLVELAIVMIIIGLLIAGVLKGQELIGNARVTSTVAQIKAIDAATSTFKDTYASLPGDITNANNRLPNCAAAPCLTGSAALGDGLINVATGATGSFAAAPAGESLGFFTQLMVANLLTGINPGAATFGGDFPASKIDGGGFVAQSILVPAAGVMPAVSGVTSTNSGLFLALGTSTIATGAVTAAAVPMKPNEASRIDTKLDDGIPGSGDVVSFGTNTAAGCGLPAGPYATTITSSQCGLYIHIQG